MPIELIDKIKAKNAGTFPMLDDVDLYAGWRVVADTTARDAIPSEKRAQGMRVRVLSSGLVYELRGGITNGDWVEVLTAVPTTDAVTVAVNGGTGSDTPTTTRPAILTEGDYSSEPFATIQAAIDAVPSIVRHAVRINVAPGTYAGFRLKGINAGAGSYRVSGTQEVVTPATGSATGTATSGTAQSLTLTGAGWTADDFQGKFCKITSGTGSGQHFIIATNTTDTLTFVAPMSPAPDGTSVFEITEPTTIIDSVTDPVASFYSGVYVTGCVGVSFRVEDFHVEGDLPALLYYGFFQGWTASSLSLYRCTANACFYGFVGQESLKSAWNQIGSLSSSSFGIGMLSMGFFGNAAFDKGWLVLNTGGGQDGIWISSCDSGGLQGVYVDNAGNNGINFSQTVGSLQYVVVKNCADGILVNGGELVLADAEVSDNTSRGIMSNLGGRIDMSNTISGSGNGTWGVDVSSGVGGIVTLTSTPTITGTSGDATVDDVNALVWATDLGAKNDYASFLPRQAHIVRASL